MESNSIKPGYRTTEAWASFLAAIFAMFNLPPDQAAVAVGGITGMYTLGRSIAKRITGR